MKKIILSIIALVSSLFASASDKYPTLEMINSNMPIIDIRTTSEWIQTGIIKDAITITFFDEKGNYNMESFLEQLNKNIDTTKPFAIICKTGNRTKIVSKMLSNSFGYDVINLKGGMVYSKANNLPIVPYKAVKNR